MGRQMGVFERTGVGGAVGFGRVVWLPQLLRDRRPPPRARLRQPNASQGGRVAGRRRTVGVVGGGAP